MESVAGLVIKILFVYVLFLFLKKKSALRLWSLWGFVGVFVVIVFIELLFYLLFLLAY